MVMIRRELPRTMRAGWVLNPRAPLRVYACSSGMKSLAIVRSRAWPHGVCNRKATKSPISRKPASLRAYRCDRKRLQPRGLSAHPLLEPAPGFPVARPDPSRTRRRFRRPAADAGSSRCAGCRRHCEAGRPFGRMVQPHFGTRPSDDALRTTLEYAAMLTN